jgi:phosphoribosylglycinamide formyltransferase 1
VLSLVVLISGGGSNLAALLAEAEHASYPARIVAVGADRDADGLLFAEQREIPSFTVPLSSFESRDEWGRELLRQIEQWRPDLVILSGFMRLLPAEVVRALAPRLLNTHPAYLPEFPGAHAVRDAMRAGVGESGASVIIVDEGVDTGPVLAQERVPVLPGDGEDELHDRIKVVERRLLADVIRQIAAGTIRLEEYAR